MKVKIQGKNVNVQIWNPQATNTIVMLHGFTGSVLSWEPIISLLHQMRVIAIDLMGHGYSDAPADVSYYDMDKQVEILEQLFMELDVQQFTLLGYSMGGRVALSYVNTYPNRVDHLILESASPGLKTEEERATRRKSDAQLATKIEQEKIQSFVDFWENIPLFASQKRLSKEEQDAIRKERLAQREIGLANSLRGMGTGSQKSLWPQLENIKKPVTLITGSLDEKFCAIAAEMKNKLPSATHIIVKDAGHAIHVENLEQFATIIKDVLRIRG